MSGTLETVDGHPALRFERRLPHAVERVWRAVTEPAELEHWFVAPVAWKPEVGEAVPGGEITVVEPLRAIAWTHERDRFRFDLRPDGDGCVLTFTHVFTDRAIAAQTASGWDAYLDRLDAHLAGGRLSEEDAHDRAGERHEHYAARFGVDAQPGRRFIAGMAFRGLELEDGPFLRLRRRYGHPAERLWRALTDAGELERWFPSGEGMTVVESEPPRRLVATWYGDTLRFDLRDEGDGCELTFTHAFADRDTAARTAAGWDRCFARLDAVLAGQTLEEAASLELWPEVHERYAATFGVDPELGRRAYAEHPRT